MTLYWNARKAAHSTRRRRNGVPNGAGNILHWHYSPSERLNTDHLNMVPSAGRRWFFINAQSSNGACETWPKLSDAV